MKKNLAVLVTASILVQLVLFCTSLTISATETPVVLIDEVYKGGGVDIANNDVAALTAIGWSSAQPIRTGNLGLTNETGIRMEQTGNAGTSGDIGFEVNKTLSYTDYAYKPDDSRVTLRRVHFKGIYDIELKVDFKYAVWQPRFINFMSNYSIVAAYQAPLSFRIEDTAVGLRVGGDFFEGIGTNHGGIDPNSPRPHQFKTRLNYTSTPKTAQLYLNGSAAPQLTGTTGAYNKDTINFANSAPYLTGLNFQFDSRITGSDASWMTIEELKVIEIVRAADPSDTAVNALENFVIASNMSEIESPLNPLPTAADLGLSGVTVMWSSSNPNIISNDGQTIIPQAAETDVIMTAKVTNDTDGFTQYVDFRLTLPKIQGPVADVHNVLTYSMLLNGNSDKDNITGNLTLPESIAAFTGVTIGWISNKSSVIAISGATGVVTVPNTWKDEIVTLTAVITDGASTLTKDFVFTVLTNNVPTALINEIYKDGAYQNADLDGLGWKINDALSTGGGTMVINPTVGIAMNKSTQGSINRSGFAVEKQLSVTEPNYGGDRHMTLRRENFKGVYDVDLRMDFATAPAGWRFIRFAANNTVADNADIAFYRLDSYFRVQNNGPIFSGIGTPSNFKTRLNYTDRTMQLYYNGSETPQYGSGGDGTTTNSEGDTFSFTNDVNSSYLSFIRFQFDERIPAGNSTRINVESLSLIEIDKAPDITDNVVTQLNTNMLTNAPDDVTAPLNPLPTAAALGVSGVTVTWTSSNPSVISNDGQTINRAALDTDIIMTAKIVNNADNFTQYADFKLTVAGTSLLATAARTLDYGMLTAQNPSEIISDLTLPLNLAGFPGITVSWKTNNGNVITTSGTVIRPSDRKNANVVLTAEITDGANTQERTFDFTVLTTYVPLPPKMLANWTFNDKTLSELYEEGLLNLSNNAEISLNSDGNLSVRKLTDAASNSNTSQFQAVGFPIRDYDIDTTFAGGERTAVYTSKLRGHYQIDYMFKITNAGTIINDDTLFSASINGTAGSLSSANGSNILLGYGRALTNIPTAPAYNANSNFRFAAPTNADDYIENWMKLRFDIDMFNETNDQVTISYAVGTESVKPNDSALTPFTKPVDGIPFGLGTTSGLLKYDCMFMPQLGFKERLPKNAAIEVANIKVTQLDKDTEFASANLDGALAQLTMSMITDEPSAYNGSKSLLPTRVVSNLKSFSVSWSSSNPDLIGSDGTFLGGSEDVGKDVYLTATVRDGVFEKSKAFWFTLGSPSTGSAEPSVSNVSITGGTSVGSTLSVSYNFKDETGQGDISEVVWQYSQGSSFYNISGASGRTYTIQSSDAGRSIRANVIPKNSAMVIGQAIASNSVLIPGVSSNGGSGTGGGSGSGGASMVDLGTNISVNTSNNQNSNNKESVFSDVSDTHWAYYAIEKLSNLNIINGDGSGCFDPDGYVTREQFAKIIALTFNALDNEANTDFTDVKKDDWSYSYIASLSKYSIILGDDNGYFNKSNNITREDMAVIIWRAAKKFGINLQTLRTLKFTDVNSISDYALEAVDVLASAEVINGFNGEFRPMDFCTRAEAAKIVYETYKLRGEQQ